MFLFEYNLIGVDVLKYNFAILLVSSLLKDKNVNAVVISNSNNTTQSKLKELEQIYKDNLITEEEYNAKRQELLSKM